MPELADKPLFSFVIPTYNEERYIAQTIADIKVNFNTRPHHEYEIIVVDNGSTDKTVEIANREKCSVFVEPGLSISELRNLGATSSNGRIIVFIDSDVSLGHDWRLSMDEFVPAILSGSRELFGSHYKPFPDTPLPIRFWFVGGYENPRMSFLPGGHTILSREAFLEIGGFDRAFSTSEDIDFCHRASDLGYAINHRPELAVIHRGDPQTIRAFLKRECWHGGSDFESVRRIFSSMTARATLLFILSHVVLLAALVSGKPVPAILSATAILALMIFTSFYLFGRSSIGLRVFNSINAYLYYLGRCCSTRALFIRSSRNKT